MKKLLLCVLAVLWIVGLSASFAPAQPVELKAVSFLPKDHPLCAMIPKWIEAVNTELKDAVKINSVGGPEVMPAFDQPEAVKKGIFQIGFMPAAYYGGLLPAADAIFSKFDFKKEREPEYVDDYFNEMHKKINMVLLGTWLYDPFYLYVKKPVKGIDELKGLKMRTAAKYDKMMLKLGMVPVTVQFGETYTALQRGVVDGFGWST